MARILVVEDERKVLRSLERGLQAEDYDVVAAATGEEGFQQASTQPFDCIVLDLLLPGRDGLQVLADLRQKGNRVPVLILTARDAVEDRGSIAATRAQRSSCWCSIGDWCSDWWHPSARARCDGIGQCPTSTYRAPTIDPDAV